MFEPRASSFLIGFSKTGYLQKILWHLSLLLPFFCITKNWHKRRALNKKEGKIQTVNFQRDREYKRREGQFSISFQKFWIEKIIFYLVVDFLLTLLGKKSLKRSTIVDFLWWSETRKWQRFQAWVHQAFLLSRRLWLLSVTFSSLM